MKLNPILDSAGATKLVKSTDGIVALLFWQDGKHIVPVSHHDTITEARKFHGIDTAPKSKGAIKAAEASAKREELRREILKIKSKR